MSQPYDYSILQALHQYPTIILLDLLDPYLTPQYHQYSTEFSNHTASLFCNYVTRCSI